ncbi:MAG: sortase family protein [Frankiales bacterium]|nr:sortase family protein [Frankiales bacterium]
MTARSSARRALGVLGELLLTAGVIVLLFGAYELWGTNLYTASQQTALHDQLTREWDIAPGAGPTAARPTPHPAEGTPAKATFDIANVPLGSGMAVLRIPALGANYDKVIVEGVGTEDLKRGPGHYPGTALPGEVGNFVVSGHRTTYGAPFNRIDELRVGDELIVQTATDWFVYRVSGTEIVLPTATDIISPVPHHPGQKPDTATMTLTTCNPEFSARERLVVYATLASTRPVEDGPPKTVAMGG